MKKYWKYLKYVVEHKKNVFIVCWRKGMVLHAISHDMSKFSLVEFTSYTKKFFGSETEKIINNFDYGWLHHQRKNKHHWDYWVNGRGEPVEMPIKYIKQMICDWEAMGIKFNDDAATYYDKNKNKMILHNESRNFIEWYFKFIA